MSGVAALSFNVSQINQNPRVIFSYNFTIVRSLYRVLDSRGFCHNIY